MALKALDQKLAGGSSKGKSQTSNQPERSGSVSSVSTQLPAYTPPTNATSTSNSTPLSPATVVIPASSSTEEKRVDEDADGADWDSDSDPGVDPKSKPDARDAADGDIVTGGSK